MSGIYISYFKDSEPITLGPFLTVSPAGYGLGIGQNWVAYEVQTKSGDFYRITIPTYHTFSTRKQDQP